MRYIIANDEYFDNIKRLLEDNDRDFPISLLERVDLDEYIYKVLKNGNIIIAVNDLDYIAGAVFFYSNDYDSKVGFITLLCVDSNFRNHGIASNLLKKAFNFMIDSKMRYCDLYTNKNNFRSINLYKKLGFYEIKLNKDEIHFRKDLRLNILITSVGRRGYLVQYFKEALNGIGKVYVSNSDSNSAAFKYADEYVVSPLIYDDHYIDFLLNYCKKNNIKLLISLFDIDLYVLACNKSKFEEIGVNVIVSDKEFVKICNDKWFTYNYLKDNKIETPKTFLSIETAIEALKNNEISFPLIIKPRWGMGSLEIFTADNTDELHIFYNKIKREIWNSYLKYESNQDRDNCVIIQQKISGDEYGVDLINDLDGNHISTIIRKKIAMRSGETDAAEIVENKMINNMMSKLANISKHIGNLDVDVLKDDNDKYYILEMNARFGGGYPFSHLAGVDLPLALIKWLNNEKVDVKLLTAKVGVIGRKDIKIIQINNSIRR